MIGQKNLARGLIELCTNDLSVKILEVLIGGRLDKVRFAELWNILSCIGLC